ncbi:MAG: hypothetical protein AB7F86_18865, partial [Bdellovibrionales bacterium]
EATTSISFDKLPPEQKNVVKDSFNLARNLYVQAKYALCLAELAKVHDIIPVFENSKELESFCSQGLELLRKQEQIEREAREKAITEQQITDYVEACKAKLTHDSTVEETKQCLVSALELSPEHPLVTEMIHSAQMHEEEKKFLASQKEEEEKKAQQGRAHYRRARKLYEKGKLSASIHEFERYVDTPYPKSEGDKAEARRQIASIRSELKTKVNFLLDKCKDLGSKNKYREAYTSCDLAVQEDPGNEEAKTNREKMVNELRREMKTIYEDSVLEESLGNVDSAKEKWRKIMNEDLEFEDYYKKAKSKLQKYGPL